VTNFFLFDFSLLGRRLAGAARLARFSKLYWRLAAAKKARLNRLARLQPIGSEDV